MKISIVRLDRPVAGIHSIDAAATDRGVCRISLNRQPVALPNWTAAFARDRAVQFARGGALLDKLLAELREYFLGRRFRFTTPIDVAQTGTPFQRRVWKALEAIPFGETRSYVDIARTLRKSQAARAIGQANGRNPVPIVVPCHRVIAASGKLGGFTGGTELKRLLLRVEGHDF